MLVLGHVAEDQRGGRELDSGEDGFTNQTWEQRIGSGIKDVERNRNRKKGMGRGGEGELLHWATLPKTREVGELDSGENALTNKTYKQRNREGGG